MRRGQLLFSCLRAYICPNVVDSAEAYTVILMHHMHGCQYVCAYICYLYTYIYLNSEPGLEGLIIDGY